MIYQVFGKRLFDIIISGLGLVILSPIFLLLSCVIRIQFGHPIFFRQVRPGFKAKPFTMIKFRSMTNLTDGTGSLLPDSDRITNFGRWLRSTSLDELPELINVLLGHMSLVGPRPLLMEYIPLYSKQQFRRHDVKPGISGLAQINGRNNLSWTKRLALDVLYVDSVSFFLDIKILFRTIGIVLKREGIVSDGVVSSPVFQGESEDEL